MHPVSYIVVGALYILGFSFVFRWINRRKGALVEDKWLITAFVVKVAAGMAYGYVYARFFEVSDSWTYFEESLQAYHDLLHDPSSFFSNGMQFHNAGNPFSTADDAFWSNAGENLLIKLLGIFNVFSGGNYYINVIFFNAIGFWGLYFIYAVVQKHIQKNNLAVFCIIFFLPSCLFWNSAIDKDGLIVFFTGVVIYAVYRCMAEKITVWRIAAAVTGFAFIFLLRNVNALLLLPAIAAWWISVKHAATPYLPFLLIYGFCVLLFFLSVYFPPAFNLPLQLAEKQHQFLGLQANTVLPLTPLEPDVGSYLRVLPEAVNHVFLRPYITEIKSPFHLMAFAEVVLVILIIMLAFITGGRHNLRGLCQPLYLFLFIVAVSGLLLIGYTVPFTGAIVRYKALYNVFLLIPFVAMINIRHRL